MLGLVAKREIQRNRYRLAVKVHGEDHPAAQAAHGRLLFYTKLPMSSDASYIEKVAYYRVSGAHEGLFNRSQRSKYSE